MCTLCRAISGLSFSRQLKLQYQHQLGYSYTTAIECFAYYVLVLYRTFHHRYTVATATLVVLRRGDSENSPAPTIFRSATAQI